MTLLNPKPMLLPGIAPTGSATLENDLIRSLNPDQWPPGPKTDHTFSHLKLEIRDIIANENDANFYLRNYIFPRLDRPVSELPYSGLDTFSPKLLGKASRGLLLNGAVEVAGGILTQFDTLPLSVAQIGVSLVSYKGEKGAYCHRLFRRDPDFKGIEPMEEVLALLEERHRRSLGDAQQAMTHMARRGLMAFAVRSVLLRKGSAPWRMGLGHPVPLEMLTGYWASAKGLTVASLTLLEQLITHERFLFVSNQPQQLAWMTLGNALKAGEYLVVDTIRQDLLDALQRADLPMRLRIERFVETYGHKVVFGLFRASAVAPPRVFYAHKDHVPTAALIAIADSQLRSFHGFPMLLDIAGSICKSIFSPQSFRMEIHQAYAAHGASFHYLQDHPFRTEIFN